MSTRTYVPVCPEHHVGGPVGYVLEEETNGVCPIIAHYKPTFAERCPYLAAHEPELAELLGRVRRAAENVTKVRMKG